MGSRSFYLRTFIPTIALLLAGYILHQLLKSDEFGQLEELAIIAWILLVIGMTILLPVIFWLKDARQEKKWHIVFHKVTHLFMGYFSYILFLTISRDFLFLILKFAPLKIFSYSKIEAIIILILPIILMFIGYLNVHIGPFIKSIKISIDNIPNEFKGFKIAQLSDLHIGPGVSLDRVKKVVEKTNAIEADIIVLTGDIIDYHAQQFASEIKALSELKAVHGVFFIVGNHEYFWNYEQTTSAIKNTNIHLLINETILLDYRGKKISISGATDPMAKFFSLPLPQYALLNEQARDADFRILLCHQPNEADKAHVYPFHLQLSGHTHRGQFIPWCLVIRFFQKYSGGLFQIGNLKLYVSQGTGFWGPPDRLGTYCEITNIEIS